MAELVSLELLVEIAAAIFVLVLVLLHLWVYNGPSWSEFLSSKPLKKRKRDCATVSSTKKEKRTLEVKPKNIVPLQDASVSVESPVQAVALKLERPCQQCGETNAKKNCSYQCCAICCRRNKNMCRGHGTGYSVALSLVESAINHQYMTFDLSYAYLKVCPPAISQLGVQLTSLNLSNNQLSMLPEDIGCLVGLEELFLQYNCLQALPDSVCALTRLVELDVKNNVLSAIPDEIGNMKKLQILNLTNNHISKLPGSVGKLRRLQEISLHSNNLHQLPEQICNITKIRIIYAGENNLKFLPSNIGCLVKLEELDVSGCCLEYLPESLSACTSLERLWLSNNRLTTLPQHIGRLHKLKELHVRNNQIKYFPASIQKLKLYTFTAQNNSFIQEDAARAMYKLPSELVAPLLELAARAVVRWKLQIHHGSIPQHLEVMLKSSVQCSQCGEHLVSHYSAKVTYQTVGFFYRAPLYHIQCLPCQNSS